MKKIPINAYVFCIIMLLSSLFLTVGCGHVDEKDLIGLYYTKDIKIYSSFMPNFSIEDNNSVVFHSDFQTIYSGTYTIVDSNLILYLSDQEKANQEAFVKMKYETGAFIIEDTDILSLQMGMAFLKDSPQ